jgi:hypothetical protein
MNIYAEETAKNSKHWSSYAFPTEIRKGFFKVDVYLDLLNFDPEMVTDFIIEAMAAYRGIQFSCGAIILQGTDADIPFIMTDSEKKLTDQSRFQMSKRI